MSTFNCGKYNTKNVFNDVKITNINLNNVFVYLALGFHHPNHPCPHQACSLGLSDKSHLLNDDEIGNEDDYEDDFDKVSYKNRPTLSPMLSTIFWSLSPRCGKVLASSTRRISARRWGGDRLITE